MLRERLFRFGLAAGRKFLAISGAAYSLWVRSSRPNQQPETREGHSLVYGFALAEALQISWWKGRSLRLFLATANLAILVPHFFPTGRRALAVFGVVAAANLICVELLLGGFIFIGNHVRVGAQYGLAPTVHAAWWIGFRGAIVVACLLCTVLHERLFVASAAAASE